MPYSSVTHDSRHPFQLSVLVAGALAGVAAVVGDFWPPSIEEAFPYFWQQLWGILFGGGALTALVGSLLKRREVGIFLEQVGLVSFGITCLTYAGALYAYTSPRSLVLASLMVMLGVASMKRWLDLERFIRKVLGRVKWLKRRETRGE
jgi:hypothetical protein